MASWAKKFEKKLSALTDNASKESIQTLANWVGFNRKHATIIAQTLTEKLQQSKDNSINSSSASGSGSGSSRQWLYWQLINEVLLMDQSNPGKWEKLQPLRTALGETTILTAMETIASSVSPQVNSTLLKEWDDKNVFGGPTIVSQIKRLLKEGGGGGGDEPSTTTTTTTTTTAAATESATTTVTTATTPASTTAASEETSKPSTSPSSQDEPMKDSDTTNTVIDGIDKMEEAAAAAAVQPPLTLQRRRSSLGSLSGKDIQYDFESKGVPAGKVDAKEFLQPCKGIATLQIARDLRNDAPVQLGSLLDNLPKDILEKLSSSADDADDDPLSEETIEDYSQRMPSKLLDLDLPEQKGNIATFKDILKRQEEARKTLIHLLLKSRCQFGSNEAAREFLELEQTSESLKKRKQLLTDALELEGLDSEIVDTTVLYEGLSKLPKLSWYDAAAAAKEDENENGEDGPNNKKQKVVDA